MHGSTGLARMDKVWMANPSVLSVKLGDSKVPRK